MIKKALQNYLNSLIFIKKEMVIKKELEKAKEEIENFTGKFMLFHKSERGMSNLTEEVLNSLIPFNQYKKKNKLTIGQRTADWITKWAGSWTFIIIFFLFFGIWIATSGYFLLKVIGNDLTDPYPFILLNLVLSCLAAIQAPVILMSQNRAAQRDRLRSEYDYQVNRKAEKEIQGLKKQLDRVERKLK